MSNLQNAQGNTLLVVSREDLQQVVTNAVENTLQRIESEKQDALIPAAKAREMLCVDKSTLWRWNKSGLLQPVRIGGKVMYKNSDICRLISSAV